MGSKKNQAVPLIIEPHPETYEGYPFITLIQYRREDHVLTIIDNVDDKTIKAYVIDFCGPEHIDEEMVIHVADYWYEHKREQYPLSIEFSKRDLTGVVSSIYKNFSVEFVSRVIGPLFRFDMDQTFHVKRRRKKSIPKTVEITKKMSTKS